MKNKSVLLCLLFIMSCASIHSGNYAVPIEANGESQDKIKTDLGLIISGSINHLYCTEYFGFIDFTFENQSDKWIRIQNVKIHFGNDDADRNIKFVSGVDLLHWKKAMQMKVAIDEHNQKLIIGSLAGLSKLIATISDDEDLKDISNVSTIGLLTSLAVNEFNEKTDILEKTKIFPDNHLLSSDFTIPPGLFTKKFLLLNSQNHNEIPLIQHLFIEYVTDDGNIESVKLRFRHLIYASHPKWQSQVLNREISGPKK